MRQSDDVLVVGGYRHRYLSKSESEYPTGKVIQPHIQYKKGHMIRLATSKIFHAIGTKVTPKHKKCRKK